MISMKEKVYEVCCEAISSKILFLRKELQAISESALNESKSTAGDKHETGRAMLHLEQEKLGNQLKELESQLSELKKIDISKPANSAGRGALLQTDKGWLFLSIGLGKIKVGDETVFVLSTQSPLGIKLSGVKAEDTVEMKAVRYKILEIF